MWRPRVISRIRLTHDPQLLSPFVYRFLQPHYSSYTTILHCHVLWIRIYEFMFLTTVRDCLSIKQISHVIIVAAPSGELQDRTSMIKFDVF